MVCFCLGLAAVCSGEAGMFFFSRRRGETSREVSAILFVRNAFFQLSVLSCSYLSLHFVFTYSSYSTQFLYSSFCPQFLQFHVFCPRFLHFHVFVRNFYMFMCLSPVVIFSCVCPQFLHFHAFVPSSHIFMFLSRVRTFSCFCTQIFFYIFMILLQL